MGNKHSDKLHPSTNKFHLGCSFSNLSSVSSLSTTSNDNSDEFIIQFNKSSKNIIKDISLLDYDLQRRAVFVSACGFYDTFDQCPSIILYSCLLVLNLKKKWIYDPSKYVNELNESVAGMYYNLCGDSARLGNFLQLLKWKESRGDAFWMLDEYTDIKLIEHDINCSTKPKINELITPFWYHLSSKLSMLYDPVTKTHYKPLNLSMEWWKNMYNIDSNHISKWDTKRSSIFVELYLLRDSMKYKGIKEIIHQSNPKSFLILTRFGEKSQNKMIKISSVNAMFGDNDSGHDSETDNIDDEWFISTDYDPFDTENDQC